MPEGAGGGDASGGVMEERGGPSMLAPMRNGGPGLEDDSTRFYLQTNRLSNVLLHSTQAETTYRLAIFNHKYQNTHYIAAFKRMGTPITYTAITDKRGPTLKGKLWPLG